MSGDESHVNSYCKAKGDTKFRVFITQPPAVQAVTLGCFKTFFRGSTAGRLYYSCSAAKAKYKLMVEPLTKILTQPWKQPNATACSTL